MALIKMHTKSITFKVITLTLFIAFLPVAQLARAAGAPDTGVILQQLNQIKQSEPTAAPNLDIQEVNKKSITQTADPATDSNADVNSQTDESNNFLLNGFVIIVLNAK